MKQKADKARPDVNTKTFKKKLFENIILLTLSLFRRFTIDFTILYTIMFVVILLFHQQFRFFYENRFLVTYIMSL